MKVTCGDYALGWTFKNMVLRKTFGPKMREVTETGEDCMLKSSKNVMPYQIHFR